MSWVVLSVNGGEGGEEDEGEGEGGWGGEMGFKIPKTNPSAPVSLRAMMEAFIISNSGVV